MEWHVLGLLIGERDSFQILMAVSILNKLWSADWGVFSSMGCCVGECNMVIPHNKKPANYKILAVDRDQ
jgi:hypothetical protein